MELVTSQQLEEMKSNGDKLLIDFFAEWCGPCKMIIPKLESFESQFPGVKFVKIDIDKNQELADALRIKGLPTLMIYKQGQMVWRQSGELDANTIISLVQEQI